MDFSPEERRRILKAQNEASRRELRKLGRKVFLGLCVLLDVLAIYGLFEADDGTLRLVCLGVFVLASVGLLLKSPLRAYLKNPRKFGLPAAGELLSRLGAGRLLRTAASEPDADEPSVEIPLSRTLTAASPGQIDAPQAAAMARPVQERGEDAESEKIDSLEGLRSRQSSGAGAKPQSEALNWILFAVICAALILAAIAVMTLFMAHPGPPAR